MIPSRIISALETLMSLRQPMFIWGAPGVGKSQVVAQVAARLGLELLDVRAILLDPVDLRGLPRVDADNRAHWSPPAFLPSRGKGVLFLDELNAAPPLVQAACYQLVLDRRLGEYELPDGWTIIAAGNRETDKSVTHRMPSALANRFVHLDFEVDLDDWLSWADTAAIDPRVKAFLRFRPNLLLDFDPKRPDKAFATPRSWEFVSRILASGPDRHVLLDLCRGTVGQGPAAEFFGFLDIFQRIPDPEAILADPRHSPVPEEPAVLYALCESLSRHMRDGQAEALVTYALRLPAEFSVLLMRDAVRRNPDMVDSEHFAAWARQHSDVLL